VTIRHAKRSVSIPVEIRVRTFRLPRPGTLATAFGLYAWALSRGYHGHKPYQDVMSVETYARWGKPAGAGGFYAEVIIAPGFEAEAMERIAAREGWGKNVRLLDTGELTDQPDPAAAIKYVVGGLLVLHGGGFAYNFLSCSRPEYRRLGTNDLLQLRALQWAQAAGMKAYLLGGGLDGEDSLFHFKAKFSSQRKGFFVGERIHLSQVYDDLSRQAIERRNGDPDESAATSWFPLYRSVPQEQEALTHEA
jgi:hypothetical protein